MTEKSAYQQLAARFARLSVIEDSIGLLHWDMSTMMPSGSGDSRGEQIAGLRALYHELLTAPALADLLDGAEEARDQINPWEQANLREMRRDWVHAAAVPGKLVEALSIASSKCEMAWRDARPANAFGDVATLLDEVLRLTREVAEIKAGRLGVSPYDALLDQYEPDGRAAEIDVIFADLEAFLPDFLSEVLERQGPAPDLPAGPFPVDAQRTLGTHLMTQLGFDFSRGRLDISLHPFCGGTPDDVRITTRYDENDFSSALMGVLHETGHALYEFGLPADWRRQPVGRARGMSLHESQSLLIEMQACRSREFMDYLTPFLGETFGGPAAQWDSQRLWRSYNRVERGFIRVDADEVTYPAHVILRYRLEQALIGRSLDVADLPGAWNEGMKKLLDIVPPDDRRGCLQDIHWFDGAFGYFPTYTLGAMTAAQLFDSACTADPQIQSAIGHGDFAPLLAWLRSNVHGHGSSLSSREILTRATGRPLDVTVFKRHLKSRYLSE
jgi:carboxypeptidase Taq